MQAEILKVRQLQKFGFPIKEIKSLLLLPKEELRIRLMAQRTLLERKNKEMEEQFAMLTGMIEQLE